MSSLAASFRASPKETVDALFAAFRDAGSTAASARVREDALCAVVRCLLEPDAFPSPGVDPAALVSELVAAASEDPKESEHPGAARVRATAVEALAVAHAAYGASQSWRLIDCASEFAGGRECAPGLRRALERRFDDGSLPAVTREGLIEHAEGADEVLRRPRPEEASHRTLETLPASLSRASSRATSRGSFSRGGGGGSGSRGGSGAGAGASGSGASGASSFHARLLKQMGRSPREVAAPGGGFPSDGSSSRASSTPSPDSSAASESESGRRAFEEPESVRDPSRLRTTSAGSGVSAASSARRSTSLGRRAAAANERRLAVKTTSERRGARGRRRRAKLGGKGRRRPKRRRGERRVGPRGRNGGATAGIGLPAGRGEAPRGRRRATRGSVAPKRKSRRRRKRTVARLDPLGSVRAALAVRVLRRGREALGAEAPPGALAAVEPEIVPERFLARVFRVGRRGSRLLGEDCADGRGVGVGVFVARAVLRGGRDSNPRRVRRRAKGTRERGTSARGLPSDSRLRRGGRSDSRLRRGGPRETRGGFGFGFDSEERVRFGVGFGPRVAAEQLVGQKRRAAA